MAATPSPSQFSRLLRQSRVATFDPSIPQVYSTPSAYAARGDWGLKRPLPSNSNSAIPGSSSSGSDGQGTLRYLEVQHIDTPEGQTTWKEREKEALFLKRWAEADARLAIENDRQGEYRSGAFGPRLQTRYLSSTERYMPAEIPGPIKVSPAEKAQESDEQRQAREYNNQWRLLQKRYAKMGAADPTYKNLDFMGEQSYSTAFGFDADKFTTRPRMMVNYNAMPEKQFESYLAALRERRSEFKTYFKRKERSRLLGLIRRRQEKAYAVALEAQKEAEKRGEKPGPPLPEINPAAVLAKIKPAKLDMLEQSRDGDATRDAFRLLETSAVAETTSEKSTRLPGKSQPTTLHPHAGLQYSQPDPIYEDKLAEPLPGRVIHEVNSRRDLRGNYSKIADGRSVLVGGHVSYLSAPLRHLVPPTIDWSRQQPKQGSALFRIVQAYRTSKVQLGSGMHRDMLTPRGDLGYIQSTVEVVDKNIDAPRSAVSEPLGSPGYIGKLAEDPSKPVRLAAGAKINPSRNTPRPLKLFYSPNGKRKQAAKGGRGQQQDSDADATTKMFENLDGLARSDRNKAPSS